MDPLAHTLFGAAMAETGLKKCSCYATATLLIGANLPDIDAVAMLWGEDIALSIRRGWSHGVLAMVVLPFVLVGGIWLWHRWRNRRRPDAPPVHWLWLVAISFVAVWSHPLLDWLNTYGIRLLMPFDDTWFYGDTLFISSACAAGRSGELCSSGDVYMYGLRFGPRSRARLGERGWGSDASTGQSHTRHPQCTPACGGS